MDLGSMLDMLNDTDTSKAFENLKTLEMLSDNSGILYPYLDEFIEMVRSEKYVIRVRGFRLLCKQAKWDKNNKINEVLDDILIAAHDEKPTAVRQALQYLHFVVPYKKELSDKIKQSVLSIDFFRFKDTMQPLITKDVQSLLALIDAS